MFERARVVRGGKNAKMTKEGSGSWLQRCMHTPPAPPRRYATGSFALEKAPRDFFFDVFSTYADFDLSGAGWSRRLIPT